MCSVYREQQSFWAWCQSSQSETCTHSRLVRGRPYSGIAFLSRSEYHRIQLDILITLLTLNRNSTVGDAARKVMGDVPISYIEGVNGTRVSEDEIVAVGKHDVCLEPFWFKRFISIANVYLYLRSSHSNLVDKPMYMDEISYNNQTITQRWFNKSTICDRS